MPEHDRALGMDRPITRRDFINGVSVTAAGALLLPRWALAMEASQEYAPERAPGYYPPALTGMRGDHDGSFEVAHALRDRRAVDLSAVSHTGESYDLVVVGAGMSGLAAAYYFVKNAGRGVNANGSPSSASRRIESMRNPAVTEIRAPSCWRTSPNAPNVRRLIGTGSVASPVK